ncbi:MAG: hypothetical protein WAU82_19605 [Candidatus Binatus sp.]|uniref:hypothetical protein n=1 Tax=Candidatus Binatus sp. TaxID=2811406 RepID=UPI003BB21CFC
MNTTTSTATTDRNSRARRAKSSSNYILTGIRTMIAATAILFAAAGYALAGSPQALRVANGTNVVEFGSLPHGTHDPKPKIELNSSVFGAPQGVVFDSSNNLWVIDGGTAIMGGTIPPSLEEFTEAQLKNLKKDPTPTPNVQITSSTDFVFPQQAVFDTAGNLWVSDNGANAVFVVTPAQLAAGGDIAFTTTIDPTLRSRDRWESCSTAAICTSRITRAPLSSSSTRIIFRRLAADSLLLSLT